MFRDNIILKNNLVQKNVLLYTQKTYKSKNNLYTKSKII